MKKPRASLLLFGFFSFFGFFGFFGFLAVSGCVPPACFGQAAAPMAQMEHGNATAAPSTSLTVIAEGKSIGLTVSDLQALPQKTVKVTNSHRNAEETYSGPLLTDVLANAFVGGTVLGKNLLHSYLKATGTDGYSVLYSGVEIDGTAHLGEVIVATRLDGRQLGNDAGQIMLVSTQDRKPQRWVRNLASVALVKPE